MQVDICLPREVAAPEAPRDPRVETDDRALDVLARVTDVETGGTLHEIREGGECLGLIADGRPSGSGRRREVYPGAVSEWHHAFHRAREQVRLLGRFRRRDRRW